MIHHVWLISRSGICILDRNYTGFQVNKQLFSGFLAALSALAAQFNRKMDSLNMEDITIYYELEGNLFIAMAVDSNDNAKEMRRKIQTLREEFVIKFGDALKDWDGNLVIFDTFVKDFDRILMLDWNFDYNVRVKSKAMMADYPMKNVIDLSQRGMDLFKALEVKGKKSEE